MESNNRIWALGAGIVVVAVVAMGWFMGVSPKLDVASANNAQRSNVELQNTIHETKLAQLKKEYEQLDSLKTDLESLRHELPATDDLSTFIGELHSLEQTSKVTVTSIRSSDGTPFVAAVPDKPAATTASDGSTTASAETTTQTATDAAAPVAGGGLVTPDNFVAIPIELVVTGSRPQVMDFVDSLQNGTRLFLVAGLTVTEDIANAAATDDAKAQDANYTGMISGFVYVLLDGASAPAAPTSTTPVEAAPAAP